MPQVRRSVAQTSQMDDRTMHEQIPAYGRNSQLDQIGSRDLQDWVRSFELRNGRKLRVLHVGNIANNAYLNAKFLRRAGVEADVLAYNYYHVMGTPEWEELSIVH